MENRTLTIIFFAVTLMLIAQHRVHAEQPETYVTVTPYNSTISVGQSALLSAVVYNASGQVVYQWYNDTSGEGSPITNADSQNLSVTGGNTGTFQYYVCVQQDGDGEDGCIRSNTVNVTVQPASNTTINATDPRPSHLVVVLIPSNVTLTQGGSQNFTAIAFHAGKHHCHNNDDGDDDKDDNGGNCIAESSAWNRAGEEGDGNFGHGHRILFTYIWHIYPMSSNSPDISACLNYTTPRHAARCDLKTSNSTALGTYLLRVNVTDNWGKRGSAYSTVIVNGSAHVFSISLMPANPVIDAGQNVIFTNTTTGATPPVSYTYMLNNSNGVTQSGNRFTFNAPGRFKVTLNGADSIGQRGSASSVVAVNTAFNNLSVSLTPQTATVSVGQNVIFTNTTTGGTTPYTYTYLLNNTNGITENGNRFTFADSGRFKVTLKVTDHAEEVGQSSSTVTVNSIAGGNLSLTLFPTNPIIDAGQNVIFTNATVGGTPPIVYTYMLNNSNGVTQSGNRFAFNAIGRYRVTLEATDSNGRVSESNSIVRVNSALMLPLLPTFSNQTVDQMQLSLISDRTPTSGTPPYEYVWLASYNNGDFPAANSMCGASTTGSASQNQIVSCLFATNTLTLTGNYTFELKVTDSANQSATSGPNTLVVNPALSDPISATPNAVFPGENSIIREQIHGGTPPYNYVWYFEAPGMGSFSAANSLACAAITPNTLPSPINVTTCLFSTRPNTTLGIWSFYVHVTDSATTPNSLNSAIQKVNVTPHPPLSVIITPSNSKLDLGQSETLNATAYGGVPPYSYTWYNTTSGNAILVSNALGRSYRFNALSAGAFSYLVQARDSQTPNAMTENSPQANILTRSAPLLTLNISPAGTTINAGDPIHITANVMGGTGPFTYNWFINGAQISNTNSSYTFSNSTGGIFTIRINATDAGTSIPYIFSNSVTVTVNQPAPPSHGGGGGGGNPGGVVGGGFGGTFKPLLNYIGGNCYIISNLTNLGFITVNFVNNTPYSGIFTVLENHISPNFTSVTVSEDSLFSKSFPILYPDNVVGVENNGIANYTLELLNISLTTPSVTTPTVRLRLCAVRQPNISNATNTTGTPSGTLNLTISGNNISVTSSNPNDTVELTGNGFVLSKGTGRATLSGSALPTGTYIIQGKDLTTNQTTSTQIYTKNPLYAQLNFTKECESYLYSAGKSCTTIAQISRTNGEVDATLYLNGYLVGVTNSTINDTQAKPGNYVYVFNTSGSLDYAPASITYNYIISNVVAGKGTNPALPPAILAIILAILTAILLTRRRRSRGEEIEDVEE